MTIHQSDPHKAPLAMLDIAAVASRLGVTERFVRRLVAERRVPFCKIGKFIRFEPDRIEAWVAAARVEDSAPRQGL